MVTILIFGLTLRGAVGESMLECEVIGPVAVKTLIEANQDRLAALLPFMAKSEILVAVNKKVGELDSVVRDGDTIKLTHQFNPTFEGATWHNP